MSNIVMGTKGSFGRLMSYHFDRRVARARIKIIFSEPSQIPQAQGRHALMFQISIKKLCNFLSKNSVEKKWILAIKDDK